MKKLIGLLLVLLLVFAACSNEVGEDDGGYVAVTAPEESPEEVPTPKELPEVEDIEVIEEEPVRIQRPDAEPTMVIALTIDDGPFSYTYRLLDILEEYDVRATFFVIGRHVQNQQEQARLIHEAGHELANHSWAHNSMGNADPDLIRTELEDTSAAIREITGEDPIFFRAPNLNYGANLTEVTAELGLPIIGADAIGQDWNDIAPDRIAANVVNAATDGGIILLHEQFSASTLRTKEALPLIFGELWNAGFEIITLGELVERRGVELQPGVLYNRIG